MANETDPIIQRLTAWNDDLALSAEEVQLAIAWARATPRELLLLRPLTPRLLRRWVDVRVGHSRAGLTQPQQALLVGFAEVAASMVAEVDEMLQHRAVGLVSQAILAADAPMALLDGVISSADRYPLFLGALKSPFGLGEPETESHLGTWVGERTWSDVDPAGQLAEVPPFAWYLTRRVRFPVGLRWSAPDWGTRQIHLVEGDHGWDLEEGDRRKLLYPIAWDDHQYSWCLNLLAPKDDPHVWSIDHDGTGAWVAHLRLSDFFAHLNPAVGA